jgi:hypothetical protein
VNVCESNSQISASTEFLNSYQDGINTSLCHGIVLENSDDLCDYDLLASGRQS